MEEKKDLFEELSKGTDFVYELDDEFKPVKHYYLGNQEELAAKINAVANQANAKK